MKRIIVIAIAMLSLVNAHAQKEGWQFKWSGMVNPHFYADNRQVVGGRENMMMFYPKPAAYDSVGNDTNAVPNINFLSITARLGLKIMAPDMLGAKVFGYIEGDFTGSTNATINNLRLRHAYIDMRWTNNEVLFGQYWYPMTIHEVMPGTCPLNMGAPFHPYARYSQIRYTHYLGNWELVGVAAFQLDNVSKGPFGSSSTYIRNSCIPEFNIQWRYHGERLFFGIAGNALTIKPRNTITDDSDIIRTTNKIFTSFSASAFIRYDLNNWTLKAQTLINDNLYEGCTMGGYIEEHFSQNSENPAEYNYKPWHYTTIWADFGKSTGYWRPGIFIGYGYNNDFGHRTMNKDQVFGRGFDIEYLYRVQPRITYNTCKGLSFTAEVEYTHAQYGKKVADDSNFSHYAHDENGGVGHFRFMLDAVFAF